LLRCKIEVAKWSLIQGVVRAQSLVLKRISVPEAYVRKAILKLSLGAESQKAKVKAASNARKSRRVVGTTPAGGRGAEHRRPL
jgi:hypothetical protein